VTTESILILALFAFLLGGVFLNPNKGPVATFKTSGPRLGAVVERDVSVGRIEFNGQFIGFQKASTGDPSVEWSDPSL
jgi:hypothetical protein